MNKDGSVKRILLTGGGTAGHVTPNLALIPGLRAAGFEIHYAGSASGIERALAEPAVDTYHAISAGKLRRNLNPKNIPDFFRVLKGFADALRLMRRLKPSVVFSKGGFVTTPVVWAAGLCGVPAVLHESDMTPGLANRLALPFAKRVCATFAETLEYLPAPKAVLTGAPLRAELFAGDRAEGRRLCGFPEDGAPTLLAMGGSLGAAALNERLRAALPLLTERFNVIHLCGRGRLAPEMNRPRYAQFEYATNALPHLYAAADLCVSRAGANTLSELLALQKPMLLVPLSKRASRGDQLQNAAAFARAGYARVLREEELTAETLTAWVNELYDRRETLIEACRAAGDAARGGTENVLRAVLDCAVG